jgi:cytochrome c6
MKETLRSQLLLVVVVFLASAVSFAQSSGQATYKAKCQMCHGATGTPSPGMAKMMGIKPVSDPAIKALTADQMFTAVKSGKGKMKPVTGLTDPQINDAVAFYRGLN